MKQALSLLLALCLTLALAACGSSDGQNASVLTKGSVDGFRYENESLRLGCELDEDWYIYSDEELAALIGESLEAYKDPEKYKQLVERADLIQDFNAVYLNGASINILFEKLNAIGNVLYDEEEYRNTAVDELKKSYLQISGVSDATVTANDFSLAGSSHPGTFSAVTTGNGTLYSQQTYIKVGKSMAVITMSSYFDTDIEVMADLFFPLGED